MSLGGFVLLCALQLPGCAGGAVGESPSSRRGAEPRTDPNPEEMSSLVAGMGDSQVNTAISTDAGSQKADGSTIGGDSTVGDLVCDVGAKQISVEGVPSFLFAPFVVDNRCEPVDGVYLLKNSGAYDLHIRELNVVGMGFSVTSEVDLPLTVTPDHTFSIRLGFRSGSAVESDGRLVVIAEEGCTSLPLRGQSFDDGLTARSHYAIDFGDVAAGTASDARSFFIVYQKGPKAGEVPAFSGFQAAPDDVFRVVSTPIAEMTPVSCMKIEVQVIFRAPSTLGPFEGSYGWEQAAMIGEETLFGSSMIGLFGRSIAP